MGAGIDPGSRRPYLAQDFQEFQPITSASCSVLRLYCLTRHVILIVYVGNTMPRRKRTREEIEEALRDNERVNATPAAPEEPAAKKRRQARRRTKRCNLNKAFEAIRIE